MTTSGTRPDGSVSWRREPGRRLNRAAVWVVTATPSVPLGSPALAYVPAVTWALPVSGSRYSTSIWGPAAACALAAAPAVTGKGPAARPIQSPAATGSEAAEKLRARASRALAS